MQHNASQYLFDTSNDALLAAKAPAVYSEAYRTLVLFSRNPGRYYNTVTIESSVAGISRIDYVVATVATAYRYMIVTGLETKHADLLDRVRNIFAQFDATSVLRP